MRAAVVPRHGPADVIEVRDDWPEPGAPGAGEVLVRVEAAGLNPSDTKIRARDGAAPSLPYVAGRELAGVVLESGSEQFAAGDHVFAFVGWGSRPGGHCEKTIVAADALAKRPSGTPLEEAAAVPLAGLTAFQGLRWLEIPDGERVLVTAGAGGVGHFGVQLAARRGLEVVATAGPANHDFVKGLGAATVLDYHQDAWADGVRGVRYVLDNVGPRNIALYKDALAPDARIAAVAGLPADLPGRIASQGIRCTASGADMSELAAALESGALRSTVQEVFPLERLADAHHLLEGGHVRGKLVIRI